MNKKLLKSFIIMAMCYMPTIYGNDSTTDKPCCNNTPARHKVNKLAPPNMIFIPGGTFMMGADNNQARADEFPKHKVTLSAYYIDKTPVTNAEFNKFVTETNYSTTAEQAVNWEELKLQLPPGTPQPPAEDLMPASLIFVQQTQQVPMHDPTLWWAWVHGTNWKHPHGPDSAIDGEDHPVVHVSWDDANAFCKYYGKRLPTEAEWEFAARGGLENKIYPWGDEPIDQGTPKANYWQGKFPYQNERSGSIYTTPVCSYPANAYGLCDMAGNVWEWVADWYDYQHYISLKDGCTNPQGPDKCNDPSEPLALKKVMRGGSFLCNEDYCTGYRVAARMRTSIDTSMEHLGFRCAADH